MACMATAAALYSTWAKRALGGATMSGSVPSSSRLSLPSLEANGGQSPESSRAMPPSTPPSPCPPWPASVTAATSMSLLAMVAPPSPAETPAHVDGDATLASSRRRELASMVMPPTPAHVVDGDATIADPPLTNPTHAHRRSQRCSHRETSRYD